MSSETTENDPATPSFLPAKRQDGLDGSTDADPDDERKSGLAAVVLVVLGALGLATWAALLLALAHLFSA